MARIVEVLAADASFVTIKLIRALLVVTNTLFIH